MKKIYLIPAFILLTNVCFAKSKEQKNKKQEEINYNEYIIKYGSNDTTTALVNLFFDKRENAGISQMYFLPITGTLSFIVPPLGISLSVISAPIFINGLITYHKYSNEKLEETLLEYKENKTLSKKMKKKVAKQIETDQALHKEEMSELRIASLKLIRSN